MFRSVGFSIRLAFREEFAVSTIPNHRRRLSYGPVKDPTLQMKQADAESNMIARSQEPGTMLAKSEADFALARRNDYVDGDRRDWRYNRTRIVVV